jgi:hypothetical protein
MEKEKGKVNRMKDGQKEKMGATRLETNECICWRSALSWDIKLCRVVIVYRHFGTISRSHLQASRNPGRFLDA